ncbi:MAG TPA: phosphoenolpyruvate carboxykinase (ATP), partial [Candidatus Marinimicrobia bacterium]|nr:phosphoenolpyruvate carboxykinase (ATP) [Candidatus Neomarinimicrobiota bacterium]
TGRSPNDKFFVKEDFSKDNLWIGPVNRHVDEAVFDELFEKVKDHYETNEDGNGAYVFDGFCGADSDYRLNVRIIARKAWQAIFVNNMFIRPEEGELDGFEPDFTIINASSVFDVKWAEHGLNSETFIIFNLEKRVAIIGGTEYGGEMKKGIFSIMHYYLPLKGVLSMHCSANVDPDGKNTALFFGLSGTGKTTLSTDSKRPLIGDDEHGWSDNGIFNFEGGCYAKAIDLNPEHEPEIYNTIRDGALAENVVYDSETKEIDFTDSSKTENTRICYPIHFIDNSLGAMGKDSMGDHPKTIIFLTCDAYGILPPVSKLTPEQAMYHFISGYTAKVAGTERGVTEPTATFSPCYGGPFLTLHPLRYAELLREKMNTYNVPCYLVNTGWIGANASSGAKRISLPVTRKIIHMILDGSIEQSDFIEDNYFGVQIPTVLDGIGTDILLPTEAWKNKEDYHQTARQLVGKFHSNFAQYNIADPAVQNAGPVLD